MEILIIYILGCIVSYFKAVACLSAEARAVTFKGFLKHERYLPVIVTLLSWVGFFIGWVTYYAFEDPFFFKWSYKDHR